MIKNEYITVCSDTDFTIVQVLLNRIAKRGATKFWKSCHTQEILFFTYDQNDYPFIILKKI